MSNILLFINSLACGLIAIRLIFYSRNGSVHKPLISLMAYLIIVATGSVPIRAALGDYPVHDISETVLNTVLCIAVFAVRGNLAQLFYGLRSQ
ncbi:phage holin family protein [Yersinia intermedia]|uniref:phage holin family protein n=1 Tax=Yersinia intermedia TaxID=631 RepID=UPI001CFF2655|nr:phage holin family protein [Yersinia intermedia]MCB5312096.1 phage holin family protein [Yersinia intermedia]MCB5326158.1 phage holin family protein [Yersinia intermedia]